ncbi:hypothetical protein AXT76_25050 [Salmonella enterica subsp. enterica serovar Enteritidis]|nr:hypothetical protein [Salmonella enterica subsp. enterica]EDA9985523.1 hypothetical protein [Salmonella enterica subsp. enterica serovar Enteritidis]
MTYFESAEGETVSKERALQELSRHCVPETDFEEFFSDMGVKERKRRLSTVWSRIQDPVT